jgi:GntR family transcriptional regulator
MSYLVARSHNGFREKYADHRGGSGAVWIVNSLPYLSPRHEGQADAWSDEAAQAGRAGTQRIREVVTAVPPADVASELGLPAGVPAVVRRRTMLLDGQPVELTDSWYPAEVAAGTPLAAPGKIKGGAVTLLSSLGYAVHEAREDIVFRAAAESEAAELGRAAGSPVIVLSRTCLTAEGTPFEASVMVMVAEDRHLRYRLIAG